MKKLITMLFIVGVTLFTASRANAQVLVVTVPFDFAVAGKTMPAATYIVKDVGDSRLFALMSDGQSILLNAIETDSTVTGGELVFHRIGSEYFLSDMVTRGGKVHFASSARERRARRAAQQSLTTVFGS